MIAQLTMDISLPTPLLGGLSPQVFMRRHWQKKPMLIRAAIAAQAPFMTRAALFAMACREEVESRAVIRNQDQWSVRQGPFTRRGFPPVAQPGWTLLVHGVDMYLPAAHALMMGFSFVPHARLDDVMVSWASDGGGVGPHVDSYDVFLLQVSGRRRWRIGPPQDLTWVADAPLRILRHFEPDQEWVLEPGDMLYLPPGWAHDGVADGECMTASIGFRSPAKLALGREVLQRILDADPEPDVDTLYRDPHQVASSEPGRIPLRLEVFAAEAVMRSLGDPHALACALGEVLSEPKPQVWFEAGDAVLPGSKVQLDLRTRMVYNTRFVFINGESFRASGVDARLMHRLADERELSPRQVSQLSSQARELLDRWAQAGWLHARQLD